MRMEDPSIFCSLQFLSSVDYIFHCKFLLLPLLSLFLVFFEAIINGIVYFIFFLSVHWCYIERLLIFVNWFCTLLLCWRCLWCLGIFLVEFFRSFRYKIMSFANRDSLTSSFPICISFIERMISKDRKAICRGMADLGFFSSKSFS
jgi:hypothetical protein